MVAQLSRQRSEDGGSRPAWTKNYQEPISINVLGVVVYTCNTSYIGRKILA
jgi:hypothetical protein